MKISEVRGHYQDASRKVSELVQQLNFAGIAVIWLLRVGTNNAGVKYSDLLLLPLALFVLSLTCHLLQYAYQSLVWGFLNTYYWRKHRKDESEVSVSGK